MPARDFDDQKDPETLADPEVVRAGSGMFTIEVAWSNTGDVVAEWRSPHSDFARGDKIVIDDLPEMIIEGREWSHPTALTLMVSSR